ncbi:MAG: YkgJ family cysteine cluster protein [Lachnospiraceae bacterium]
MVHPDKVGVEAKKREDENFKFCSFLKGHADEKELDEQFLRLHKELFADYDCSKCRNCCKMYKGSIPKEDVEKDAEYLGITVEQFIDFFLEKEETSRKGWVVCWGCWISFPSARLLMKYLND